VIKIVNILKIRIKLLWVKFWNYFDFLVKYQIPIHIKKKPIILIYQMGKVGSTSIQKSLEIYGIKPVFHIHFLDPSNISLYLKSTLKNYNERTLFNIIQNINFFNIAAIYKDVVLKHRKSRIITIVREPIGRNISAFFQVVKNYAKNILKLNLDELTDLFFNRFDRHSRPLEWFDTEFKKTLNIDIYQHSFPIEKGYQILKENNLEILILKLEIDDQKKEEAISEFLGLESKFKWTNFNVGESKNYSTLYKNFKEKIKLPRTYIEQILNSKYIKHFYSDEEIEAIEKVWL